jgi:hypothetical protein
MADPVLTLPLPRAHLAPTQTLKVQRVSPSEMDERRKKGIFFYCDEK